ncbi:MAG: hypothetical protein AAFX04_13975 [Pseudomonadota bacterium]
MADQTATNYTWFQQNLSDLLINHRGQHALIHNQKIVGFFQTSLEAIKDGLKHYGENNFSVECVDDKVEDLGFYSHVSAALHA